MRCGAIERKNAVTQVINCPLALGVSMTSNCLVCYADDLCFDPISWDAVNG